MRDREEILQEMSEARVDLAHNVSQLRDAIAAKVDVRARADRWLDNARVHVRARPRLSIAVALGLGVLVAR